MVIDDIILRYPLKNPAWDWWEGNDALVAEASELGLKAGQSPGHDFFTGLMNGHLLDPWNRRFPYPPEAIEDLEGDILFWKMKTSVNGQTIICKIIND
jgi:hypothetical protein